MNKKVVKKKEVKKTYWRKDYAQPSQFKMPTKDYRELVSLFKQAGYRSWQHWLEPVLTEQFSKLKKTPYVIAYTATNETEMTNTPSIRIDKALYSEWVATSKSIGLSIRALIKEFTNQEYQVLKGLEAQGKLDTYSKLVQK
ncbi:MAG: hypothetical protein CV087_08320 [Candidatus Brocadia sp. WS118]|nr:MAG: hypothetical protein CV087_08320 [Candidatus Brocadia sp. WS118]